METKLTTSSLPTLKPIGVGICYGLSYYFVGVFPLVIVFKWISVALFGLAFSSIRGGILFYIIFGILWFITYIWHPALFFIRFHRKHLPLLLVKYPAKDGSIIAGYFVISIFFPAYGALLANKILALIIP